jgi:hypothetical protein
VNSQNVFPAVTKGPGAAIFASMEAGVCSATPASGSLQSAATFLVEPVVCRAISSTPIAARHVNDSAANALYTGPGSAAALAMSALEDCSFNSAWIAYAAQARLQ